MPSLHGMLECQLCCELMLYAEGCGALLVCSCTFVGVKRPKQRVLWWYIVGKMAQDVGMV